MVIAQRAEFHMLRSPDFDPHPPISEHLSKVRTPPLHVVVLEEDGYSRDVCEQTAGELRFVVSGAKGVRQTRSLFRNSVVDILLVNPYQQADHGFPFIEEVKHLHPETEIIALAPKGSRMTTADVMRLGVTDYLLKPLDRGRLVNVLDRTRQRIHAAAYSRRLRERLHSRRHGGTLVGSSPHLQKLRQFVSNAAGLSNPVLIKGEMGSGKKLVARTIHINSDRASAAIVSVECNSLSPALRGSELFGHSKGVFRGADWDQRGLLIAADGGTVLLEEITELSLEMQAALLKTIQEKKVTRIGSTESSPLSVRIIATTSQNIGQMVEDGRFRKDLFNCLNLFGLRVLPLREHPEDIQAIVAHFLERISFQMRRSCEATSELLAALTQYRWPGNVIELENALEDACSRSRGGSLTVRDFSTQFQESMRPGSVSDSSLSQQDGSEEILPMAEVEKRTILSALRSVQGDTAKAAQLLRIGRTTIYRKLKHHKLDESNGRGASSDRSH